MSQDRQVVLDTLDAMLKEGVDAALCDRAEAGEWPHNLWRALDEAGLTTASVPEELGGSGLDFADALALLLVVGRHTAPIPLAEHLLAARHLAEQGVALPNGLISIAFADEPVKVRGDAVTTTLRDVPYGHAASLLIVHTREGEALLVQPLETSVDRRVNLAGEPRDIVHCSDTPCREIDTGVWLRETVYAHLALTRALASAGAMESVLDMSIDYVQTRKQFGKTISGFQAVQHLMAQMAGEVAAAKRAADAALDAVGSDAFAMEVAAARARIGEASGCVATIAHQVHGAMGFTHEHRLHHFTRRLWAWRDEYGSESEWQRRLARAVISAGADSAFEFLTQGSRFVGA